jgi:hypothetical protein
MLYLYQTRVRTSFLRTLAAGLAGLALSHTIAKAMFTGFFTRIRQGQPQGVRRQRLHRGPFDALFAHQRQERLLGKVQLGPGSLLDLHFQDWDDVGLHVTLPG